MQINDFSIDISAPSRVNSYYEATRNREFTQPELTETLKVETCVIGAGLAGLGAALPLAKAGRSVAVLEAAYLGFGASGRNGGQVIIGYAAHMANFVKTLGLEKARQLWQFSIEGVNLVEQQVKEYAIDCQWTRGYANVAIGKRAFAMLAKEREAMQQAFGYHGYALWDKAKLQETLSTERYAGALFDTDSGHLHPLNYQLGIAQAVLDNGGRIFEHSPMTRINKHPEGYEILTPKGKVLAQNVVLSVNVFNDIFAKTPARSARHHILPVGTYIIATEPLGERASALIRNNMAVCDTRSVVDYYRLSADNRLLFGGRVDYGMLKVSKAEIKQKMRRDMLKVFPQLEDVRIDYAWGGLVDTTMTRQPDFGNIDNHLYYLQGFSGHGVALTGYIGAVVAEAIMGDASRWAAYQGMRTIPFPKSKLLAYPTRWLGINYHRVKDYLLG